MKYRSLFSQVAALTAAMFVLLTCAVAQEQPRAGQPEVAEFAVSSTRTYMPGEQPKVAVYYRGLRSLDFRVYRVQDPVALFSRLKDPHQFGEARQHLLDAYTTRDTPIERVHTFKRDLRTRIRDFFRLQLSPKTREAFRPPAPAGGGRGPSRVVLNASAYAAVPLLNPSRLAASWREMLPISAEPQRSVLPVEVKDAGVYLVEAVNGTLTAYTVLLITDYAVLTKSSPQQMLVYTIERKTGKPAAADVVLYREGQRVGAGRSDATGLFSAPMKPAAPDEAEESGMLVMARVGSQFAISGLEQWEVNSEGGPNYKGYVYTDRPVYRPGHKAQFKGIIRVPQAGRLVAPGGIANVQISGPENEPIFNRELRLNEFGSFSGTWDIPAEPSLGVYSIQVTIDGKHAGSYNFHVEEYRKPDFEVKVAVDKPQYTAGEKIKATINARYYFGAPVAGAKLKYSIYRSTYWPYFWSEYIDQEGESDSAGGEEGGGYDDRSYYMPPEFLSEQEAVLDADGKLQVEIPTEPDNEKRRSYTYRVDVRVTDAGDREVIGAGHANVLYSDIGVFGSTEKWMYQLGDTVTATFKAVDQQGKAVQTPLQFSVVKRNWVAGKLNESQVHSGSGQTDAQGAAQFSFKVPATGDYVLRAQMTDPRGRIVVGEAWAWVWNEQYAWDSGDYASSRIKLMPDKKKYKVGDTARVVVMLPEKNAHVLLTSEGEQILSSSVRSADASSFSVDVPVTAAMVPNFYLSATFVKNNKLYEGSRKISVPADEKKLTVEITPDRTEYKPGQEATYTVQVRDAAGKPASAEVSLGIVDESIYAVRGEYLPDIHKFFYADQYSRVITRFSTSYHFYGYSGDKRMELVFKRKPYQLADFKDEGQQVQVRKRFLDTAYWQAHLVTGADGRGQARFALPDNLTTWRATVRAITSDTRAGASVQKVLARKNLMLRLETPRFLTQRDSATVIGVIHNYLPSDQQVRVSMEAGGVELTSALERTISVPKNGIARVEWQVKAYAPGEARFLAKALARDESDALEWRIPVKPYGLMVTQARSGQLTGDGTVSERITLPRENPDSNALRIDLAPSAAGTMMSALEYLTTFPYGCVEQTMSSFLPNVIVARTVKELKLPPLQKPDELARKVNSGLKRLYGFQHEDGGWGWWKDDGSHPFMTAYVVYGLREAQLAGYEVRADIMKRGLTALEAQLARAGEPGPETRAYMAYALLNANPSAQAPIDTLMAARDKFSPIGRALLALALSARRDPRAMDLAAELERVATSSESETWWESKTDPMLLHATHDNSVQASALAVKALAGLRPSSPLLPRAVKWLVAHRKAGYYWNTTLTTATVIFGITDYLRRSRELEPEYSLEVLLNGKPVVSKRFTRAEAMKLEPVTVRIPAADLSAGDNTLEIRKQGTGVLYWSAAATSYTGGDNIGATQRSDLTLSREYFRLVRVKQGERYVFREEPLSGAPLPVGEMLSVRLKVTGREWEYVLIEDPLPAGFETVERDDIFQFEQAPDWYTRSWWTRRELHDDRVAFFQTSMFGRKEANYRYMIRASTAGDFQVMPARVQPMYQPEIQATTANMRVSVKPGGAQ